MHRGHPDAGDLEDEINAPIKARLDAGETYERRAGHLGIWSLLTVFPTPATH